MAAVRQRQFGFTFLLFVPILAYWGYGTFKKWYLSLTSENSAAPKACNESPNATDHCDAADPSPTSVVEQGDCEQPQLTSDNYRQAFTNIQQGVITSLDCPVLRSLLQSADTTKLIDGLQLILKLSVTSKENKSTLFENGIALELKRIIRCRRDLPLDVAINAINAVSNLSLSDEGQRQFVDIVSELTDISVGMERSMAITALQCLTNISVTSGDHISFTKVIQSLYRVLDTDQDRRLHVCRVLVNLSSSKANVPFLLSAKSPECSIELLVGDTDIALRWLRMMTNIAQTVLADNITQSSLPTIFKAASPETAYSFLYGSSNQTALEDALLGRKSGADEELTQLANTLYRNIKLKLMSAPSVS